MRTEKFCRLKTFGDLKFLHFGAFFSLSIEVEVIWDGIAAPLLIVQVKKKVSNDKKEEKSIKMIKSIKTAPIKTEEGFYFNERSKKKINEKAVSMQC